VRRRLKKNGSGGGYLSSVSVCLSVCLFCPSIPLLPRDSESQSRSLAGILPLLSVCLSVCLSVFSSVCVKEQCGVIDCFVVWLVGHSTVRCDKVSIRTFWPKRQQGNEILGLVSGEVQKGLFERDKRERWGTGTGMFGAKSRGDDRWLPRPSFHGRVFLFWLVVVQQKAGGAAEGNQSRLKENLLNCDLILFLFGPLGCVLVLMPCLYYLFVA